MVTGDHTQLGCASEARLWYYFVQDEIPPSIDSGWLTPLFPAVAHRPAEARFRRHLRGESSAGMDVRRLGGIARLGAGVREPAPVEHPASCIRHSTGVAVRELPNTTPPDGSVLSFMRLAGQLVSKLSCIHEAA